MPIRANSTCAQDNYKSSLSQLDNCVAITQNYFILMAKKKLQAMQVWLLGFKQEQSSYLYNIFCLLVLYAYMYTHTELHPTEFITLISTSNVHLSS